MRVFCLVGLLLIAGSPGSGRAESPVALPEFVFGIALPPAPEPKVDLVRVLKSRRRLILLAQDEKVVEYGIALGKTPDGPKREAGDGRTPEGRYVIDWRKPDSDFYRALHISYPDDEDIRRAQEQGVEPGGAIMIHGLPNGLGGIGSAHLIADWTDGCIAVTNEEMQEIWERVEDGVPIEILP